MALTQSVRIPGPSWDEEVVPALRKRLESESRTLARRMSAISLSSVEDAPSASYVINSDTSTRVGYEESQPRELAQSTRTQRVPLAPPVPTTTANHRLNGTSTSPTPTNFQRARTYSTPYASDYPNGRANGKTSSKNSASKSPDPSRSLSPRPTDAKPTRIPVATRPPISSNSSYPSSHGASVTPSAWSPEQSFGGKQKTVVPSSSSQSLEISNRGFRQPGLLNEAPPFSTDTTLSSSFSQPTIGSHSTSLDLSDPPRASMESEERPFEHWYRGEVSRNGGVGELRVGRRQEMLDIANYGHMVRRMQDKQQMEMSMRTAPRKRADSIAGITNQVRERNSLIIEDEYIHQAGMVLDETPLTDLDGEESEAQSATDQYIGIAYAPEEGDMASPPSQRWTTVAGAHEMARSATPTQNDIVTSMIPKPSSRSQTPSNIPPPRIPGPSSRRNSLSLVTPTNSSATTVVASSQSQNSSPKQQSARSPPSPQILQKPRHPQSSPGTPQKRHVPPAQKKVATAKMAKSKTLPAKQETDKRNSVARYPTVDGESEDMADAIPSWTQPVVRQGNWDDVVLPVVARKKGLDGYESADGSPKPRRVSKTVEPAPGTFGFDHSKYRPPRGDGMSIPMDEFGRQTNDDLVSGAPQGADDSDEFHEMRLHANSTSPHDETQLPARQGHSPSPAPFSDYPASTVEVRRPVQNRPEPNLLEAQAKLSPHQQQSDKVDDEEGGSGCCKCVVM